MNAETLAILMTAVPGVAFLAFAAAWLLGWRAGEALLARTTKASYAALVVVVLALLLAMRWRGVTSLEVDLGHWFEVGGHGFPLVLLYDRLSLAMSALTIALVGIVASFSARYLHRDPGYFRFFLLLNLFGFGSLLLFAAASLDLLLAGWELVGASSVMLVGFFQRRREPVENALRVFATYRIADLFMLLAILLSHRWSGSAIWRDLFSGEWPNHSHAMHGAAGTTVCLLLILAASGKSSLGPFSGWLPRAMEGPTPSSAIFYGAISVHAGAYLLLRIQPLVAESSLATGFLIFVGATTAFLATLAHRTSSDAKASLSYAAMTQLGIIFTEIGLGWTTLALMHVLGHAVVRTAQFLRAPSMLHDYHQMHAAAGGRIAETGRHYRWLVPPRAQLWLYTAGLERGGYDAIVERLLVAPARRLSGFLGRVEPADWIVRRTDGGPRPEEFERTLSESRP